MSNLGGTDILATILRITLALAPAIRDAIAAGSTEGAITASAIAATRASEMAAHARVDDHAGHVTSPLRVEAVHLRDRSTALRALLRPGDARCLDDIADNLERDARQADDASRHATGPER